jgi:hypothetical protein
MTSSVSSKDAPKMKQLQTQMSGLQVSNKENATKPNEKVRS